MTIATLAEVLQPAWRGRYAVAGLVVLGWEDARAFVEAAEAEKVPVILQAGPACREHTPLPVLGCMFRHLAEAASVPIVAHLDHGFTLQECRSAIDCGFTSVMYDGSRNSLAQNIDETTRIAEMAHTASVSCEGEIGFVGYCDGAVSARTTPDDAARFARDTGVDAMAISVGNVHLQRTHNAVIDFDVVHAIEAVTRIPLVLHGGSGIPPSIRTRLARETSVCKFNIGTELRTVFGASLRSAINRDAQRFDRLEILKETIAPVRLAAQEVIRSFGPAAAARH